MITSTSQFQQTVLESHKIATKVVVYNGNTPLAELSVNEGNVRIDASNKFRRTADVQLSDWTGTLTPSDITDLLSPLSGNEVRIWRGVYVPSLRVDELILLGVFVIKDVEIFDSGANVNVILKLVDRSLRISEARNPHPFAIYPGATVGSAIKAWVLDRYPDCPFRQDFDFVAQIEMSPGVVDRGSDLLEVEQRIAKDVGYDLRFDNEGYLDLVPLPSGNVDASQVVAEFVEGPNNTTLSIRKDLTRDDTYNHVVAFGQATDGIPPVWGEAKEENPDHPLNIYGPMGDKPFFYGSGMFRTTEQCEATAAALLYKHLGHSEHIHFNNIVNPCLEDGDVVKIVRAKSKVNSYYSLDNITIPLVAIRAMECDTRERFIINV